MSMTDPIADLLTRIRNAHLAKHDRLDVPVSKLKLEVCRLLKEEGFIRNFREIDGTPVGHRCASSCATAAEGEPAITHVERVSKPGRRVYRKADEHPAGAQRPRRRDRLHVAGPADRRPGARAPGRRRAPLRGLVGERQHVADWKNADPGPERDQGRGPGRGVRRRGARRARWRRRCSPAIRSRSKDDVVTVERPGDTRAGARAGTACCGRCSPTPCRASRRASPSSSTSSASATAPRSRGTRCSSRSATRTRCSSTSPRGSRSRSSQGEPDHRLRRRPAEGGAGGGRDPQPAPARPLQGQGHQVHGRGAAPQGRQGRRQVRGTRR